MEMKKNARYAIFRTKWGYFGLAGTDSALCRSGLPSRNREKLGARLLTGLSDPKYDANLFKSTQRLITAYFEGDYVDLGPEIPVRLDGMAPFFRSVLNACRAVEYGRRTTYAELARSLGRPTAARAVGNALAANPLPLIIPCHRVLRRDGKLGGFSAPGGTALKARMLLHEKRLSHSHASGPPGLPHMTAGSDVPVTCSRTVCPG